MTIFEKVMDEVKNIENCIEHYIQVATKNQKVKFSAIDRNESQHIKESVRLSNYKTQKSFGRATSSISPSLPVNSFDSSSSESDNSQNSRVLGNALDKNEECNYVSRESSFHS